MEADDAVFPRRLRGASGAPGALHVRGILRDCERSVAIVGSRAACAASIAKAGELAHAWAARGHLIVSGGAVGVDAAAHRGALESGVTWAVLGSGVDVPYPIRNAMLFDLIVERGGAVVSPYAMGAAPLAWQFVRRNAIIAALADAVVVVAADTDSGSLHTARAATSLGRRVLAVPGTRGTDRLIALGAAVCEAPDDLDLALGGRARAAAPVAIIAGSDEALLLAVLDRHARSTDDLAAASGLGAQRATAALVELDLLGLAIALPGRNYVRSTLLTEAC